MKNEHLYLEAWRDLANLSPLELAKLSGIGQKTIWSIENELPKQRQDRVIRNLTAALNLPPGYLQKDPSRLSKEEKHVLDVYRSALANSGLLTRLERQNQNEPSEEEIVEDIMVRYRRTEYRIGKDKMISALSRAISKVIQDADSDRGQYDQADDSQSGDYDQTGS